MKNPLENQKNKQLRLRLMWRVRQEQKSPKKAKNNEEDEKRRREEKERRETHEEEIIHVFRSPQTFIKNLGLRIVYFLTSMITLQVKLESFRYLFKSTSLSSGMIS